jgi:hypothetical protein
MWLLDRLTPDFKTIANFRKDNVKAICKVCSQFITLCRQLNLLTEATVAIDGSKFKAVNSYGNNFSENKIKRRREYIEASINRYLSALETADRQDKADFSEAKSQRLQEKIALLKEQMAKLESIEAQLKESPDKQISSTDPDARAHEVTNAAMTVASCSRCPNRPKQRNTINYEITQRIPTSVIGHSFSLTKSYFSAISLLIHLLYEELW